MKHHFEQRTPTTYGNPDLRTRVPPDSRLALPEFRCTSLAPLARQYGACGDQILQEVPRHLAERLISAIERAR